MEGVRAEINTLSVATMEHNKVLHKGDLDSHLQTLVEQLTQQFDAVEERFTSALDAQTMCNKSDMRRAVMHDAEIQTVESSSSTSGEESSMPNIHHARLDHISAIPTDPHLLDNTLHFFPRNSSPAAQLALMETNKEEAQTSPTFSFPPSLLDQTSVLLADPCGHSLDDPLYTKNAPVQQLALDNSLRDQSPSSIYSAQLPEISPPATSFVESSCREILSILLGYIRAFGIDVINIWNVLDSLTEKYARPPRPQIVTFFLLASLLFVAFTTSVYLSHNTTYNVESDHPVWTALQNSDGSPSRAYEILYHK